jgi:hypothetical protein
MKLPSLLLSLSICAAGCASTPSFSARDTSAGPASSPAQTALSDFGNPAAARRIPPGRDRYHIAVRGAVGYELGEVDDFINRIDDLDTELKLGTRSLSLESYLDRFGFDGPAIADAVVSDLNSRIIDVVNRQIDLISTNSSYATAFGSLDAPMQFAQPDVPGVFELRSGVTSARDVWALGEPLDHYTVPDLEQRVVQAINSPDPSVDYLLPDTDTAILMRTAIVNSLSLGYSREIGGLASGQLLAGVRANYYKVELTRYARRLTDFVREELSNEYQDTYTDDNGSFGTAVGFDVGVAWTSRRARLGALVANINESRFRYRPVDAANFTGSAIPDRLNEHRTWTMRRQLRLEGGLNTVDRIWSLGTALDGNAVEDPLGHEYRWFMAGAAYSPRDAWIPGLRLRYHANTVGSETRYVTTGVTLFNAVSLDMTRSLDSVYIEQNDAVSYHGKAPRSLIYSLRIELGI